MEFFKKLSELIQDKGSLTIHVAKKGEVLSVMVMPKTAATEDSALKKIEPLVFTGSDVEFDAYFFEMITKPLEKVNGLITNIAQFEASVKEAEKESKPVKAEEKKTSDAKKKEDKKAVAATKKPEAKVAPIKLTKEQQKAKSDFDTNIKKGDGYLEKKEYDKAIFMYKGALATKHNNEAATAKITEAEKLQAATQTDIFSAEAQVEPEKQSTSSELSPLQTIGRATRNVNETTPTGKDVAEAGAKVHEKLHETLEAKPETVNTEKVEFTSAAPVTEAKEPADEKITFPKKVMVDPEPVSDDLGDYSVSEPEEAELNWDEPNPEEETF